MKAMIAVTLVLGAVVAASTPEAAQRTGGGTPGPDRPVLLRRWVAVTHVRDYRQQAHHLDDGFWLTLTSVFGINGTDRVADTGLYVFGQGQLFYSVFSHLQPGREQRLLPGSRHFGPGAGQGPNIDGEPPEYKGEMIVVVSTEPIIVTGAVVRGFQHYLSEFIDYEFLLSRESASQSSRTLDVRQFDCSVKADFVAVAQFCRLSPREQ